MGNPVAVTPNLNNSTDISNAAEGRPFRVVTSCVKNFSSMKTSGKLVVKKFGGTSVGSLERIEAVADRVLRDRAQGQRPIVVASAMSGETNRLVRLANDVNPYYRGPAYDMLLASGEQVSIALLSIALEKKGAKAVPLLAHQVGIQTDAIFSKARIKSIDTERLKRLVDNNVIPVVAGFQGVTEDDQITTLGRGGSDTTAVALAAALGSDECEIYTDVDGVYTTDPRVVDSARRLDKITFEEMLEMASLGSKVLQIRAVEFAGKYNVPLRVLHSFKEGPGTLITLEEELSMEQPVISGIAFNRDEAKLTIRGVPDTPGVAYRILGPVSAANIEI